MNEVRIEEDLLGAREVPAGAYYGIHTVRVGKECARTGKTVREVVLQMGLLSEAELDSIFSPENLIRPEFRGKVFASQAGSATVPKSVTP